MDDFLIRALLAGVGVAVVAGPFGCFVVWRRLAYFGDTMAHAALLGVAVGLVLGLDTMWGVAAVALATAGLLAAAQRQRLLAGDTVLGILSHGSLALGLVVISFLVGTRVDLMGYLFGDILSVGMRDLVVIYGGGVILLGGLAFLWRPLLAATVDEDMARIEGLPVARLQLGLMLLIALVIAVGIKLVGILLITALMIVPAAAARRFATTPEAMALLAAGIGGLSAAGGLGVSLVADTPSGPTIVLAAAALFLIAWGIPRRLVAT